MSRCERTERAPDYALRVLSADEAATFEAHLRDCAACRAEVDDLRAVVDALVDWPTDVVRTPAPLWTQLARRVGADPDAEPARWPDEPPWNEVAPGISCKLLATDAAITTVSMLVRLAPGVAYPAHTHAGVEELHLLDGTLWIDDRELHPGDYSRAEPGTRDRRVWSATGCTCVLVTSFRDELG